MRHAELKYKILLSAATDTVSVMQRIGYQCALHGPLAVYLLGEGKLKGPPSWEVFIFVDSSDDLALIRRAVQDADSDHFDFSEDGILMYHCKDPDLLQGQRKTTYRVHLSVTLDNFTFAQTPDLVTAGLPLVPDQYLIYEFLKWTSQRNRTSTAKPEALHRSLEALLKRQRAGGDQRGGFTEQGAKHMSEMMELFTLSAQKGRAPPQSGQITVETESIAPTPTPQGNQPRARLPRLTSVPGQAAASSTATNTIITQQRGVSSGTARAMEAAWAAVCTLWSLGYSAAIFGGLACSLYGIERPPQDADILVLPGYMWYAPDPESLKRALVSMDPVHFYARASKNPGATYRVLYYRRPEPGGFTCKVDILLPGILHLPALAPAQIIWIEGLPVIPFALLLLQKLQAYDDHQRSLERHHFVRWEKDKADIDELLGIQARVREVMDERPWADRGLFSDEFMALSARRVEDYATRYECRAQWRDLGFAV